MNERLIQLRKCLGYTQTEMGDKLGMSRSAIANLELGRVEFAEMAVLHICHTFCVNQHWFRTGEGEMFESPDDFEEVARQLNLNEFQRRLVQLVYEMPIEHQRIFRDYAERLVAEDEAARVVQEETEHERIERVANDYLEAHEAQLSQQQQSDKRA